VKHLLHRRVLKQYRQPFWIPVRDPDHRDTDVFREQLARPQSFLSPVQAGSLHIPGNAGYLAEGRCQAGRQVALRYMHISASRVHRADAVGKIPMRGASHNLTEPAAALAGLMFVRKHSGHFAIPRMAP
jgi:hypothetical protein